MKKLAIIGCLACFLGGCATTFFPREPITVYQGADSNGKKLGSFVYGGGWYYLPDGFEQLYFQFASGRGGDYTLQFNATSSEVIYLVVHQKPGAFTPDLLVTQANDVPDAAPAPPLKAGMARVYILYRWSDFKI